MATNKVQKIKSLVALMLILAIFASMLCNLNSKAYAASKEINGHEFLCENDNYRLYFSEEDLSIVVEDKKTGAYMESAISYDDKKSNKTWYASMKSALVLTMINKSVDTKQADLINDKVTKKITKNKNGFKATVFWTKYQFGMDLEVTLTENGVVARVPDESIIENGTDYQIGTISIYPFMGSSYLDSKEGYMFIPDGNGALIYLNDKEGKFSSGYSSMIYGSDIGFSDSKAAKLLWDKYETVNDTERVIAPVYGIAHTDDKMAYLAVVEEGAMRATIEAWPNGASVNYNRAYAKFIERKLYTQPTSNNSSSGSFKMAEEDRSHSDLQVRFIFLNGENANYCGMANAYREYLLANGTLTKTDTSYKTRIDFLGTERKDFLLGTKAVVMTTVDDIEEIYEDLKSEGVTDILSVYKGWQKGGLYNLPITSYDVDKNIGGKKKLTSLIKNCETSGIEFYLYNNALLINPDENNATFNVVKRINKRKFELETNKDVYETMMYLIPGRTDTLLNKFVASYTKSKINNLCIAGITDTIYSWNYGNGYYTRYDCAESYKNTLDTVALKTNLVLEQPNAYLWADTKAFLDMPLYISNFMYEEDSVPFLSIVLKGVMPVYSEYTNFEANKREFFLKLVETGTYPSFYITKESSSELIYTNSSDIYSSEYASYKDTIVNYTKELEALSKKLQGAVITGHEINKNGITKVTYSNGVKIYLNYSNTKAILDGQTIEAMTYKVVD